jgi:hypothetical protein
MVNKTHVFNGLCLLHWMMADRILDYDTKGYKFSVLCCSNSVESDGFLLFSFLYTDPLILFYTGKFTDLNLENLAVVTLIL